MFSFRAVHYGVRTRFCLLTFTLFALWHYWCSFLLSPQGIPALWTRSFPYRGTQSTHGSHLPPNECLQGPQKVETSQHLPSPRVKQHDRSVTDDLLLPASNPRGDLWAMSKKHPREEPSHHQKKKNDLPFSNPLSYRS